MGSIIASTFRLGAAGAFLIALPALVGCSTVKSLSPFGSGVPYAQDIKPTTVPQPASPEIPAYKTAPAAVSLAPQPQPAPSVAPSPAPAAAAAPTAAPATAPAQSSAVTPDGPVPAKVASNTPNPAASSSGRVSKDAQGNLPSIPVEDREFKDDGRYPNLAQVPARPVDLPSFAEASAVEKQLIADRTDTTPKAPVTTPAATTTAPATPVAAVSRPEDSAPCLDHAPTGATPTATVHFEGGSAALTADGREVLAEAIPGVRGGTGTIRILGHGDTEVDSAQMSGRFTLAVARAGAVAEALAGFGVPVQRIAVGVACTDAAMAGASVQLFAES